MNTSESQAISSHPRLIEPIRAGFNIAANHLYLLLFPLLLDLWIWLGPHFSMQSFMSNWLESISAMASVPSDQWDEFARLAREALVDRFNLMTALRTYPVGVPSLMTSRLPIISPFGEPAKIELLSIVSGVQWFLGLTLAGLALGTFYYLVVAQVAQQGQPDWRAIFRDWPRAFWHVFCLVIVWIAIAVAISIPFSCLIPVLAIGGVSQFALFVYLAVLAWLFYPLILSAHGIFVHHDKMPVSLMKSVQLTRLTMPATTLFYLFSLVITQGLDIIWRWPEEKSLIVLIGITGHAFVTTAILAASFIYYREAYQWLQRHINQLMLRQQVS